MQPIKLLLVDDDQELTALLSEYFSFEGLVVSVANNAEQALQRLNLNNSFDIAVFDIMMPGLSGLDLLQQLRAKSKLPVIMLTGKGGDVDQIVGLEMGADDYMAKPGNPRELLARIKAVLRRTSQSAVLADTNKSVDLMGVSLRPTTREVFVKETFLELTSAEFNVLHQLMLTPGVVVSKSKLTEKVLHRALTPYDRSIDVHLSRVRQKLAAIIPHQELIKTVRGEGYIFIVNNTRTKEEEQNA